MNVAAQLLAAEEGIDASPASSRVHAGGGAWVTLHAARLQASTSMPATIAVTVDPITLADRVDVFSGATGLTTRGCLNLNGDNAIWFFNFSIPGDVVEIRNTGGPPLRLDQNGD
jgi:hypothetical protein